MYKGGGLTEMQLYVAFQTKNINAGKKVPEQCIPKVEKGNILKYDLKIGW
jgi:hypothetical protein